MNRAEKTFDNLHVTFDEFLRVKCQLSQVNCSEIGLGIDSFSISQFTLYNAVLPWKI